LAGDAWSQLTVALLVTTAAGYLLAARTVAQAETSGWRPQLPTAALAVAGLAAVLLAGRVGAGLPEGTRDALQGRLAFTDDATAEPAVALRLRPELGPGKTALVAGWPGFAVALLEGDLGQMTLLPTPTPPAPGALPSHAQAADLLLVREDHPGDLLPAWQAALPAARLHQAWRVDSWTCYRTRP
jgi:hypothetical protein